MVLRVPPGATQRQAASRHPPAALLPSSGAGCSQEHCAGVSSGAVL